MSLDVVLYTTEKQDVRIPKAYFLIPNGNSHQSEFYIYDPCMRISQST